jgi:hypothetical protein
MLASLDESKTTLPGSGLPEISVVVSTGALHHRTMLCLEGVFAEAGIEECEVIVVDGSAGDHSDFYARFPGLRYVRVPERTPDGEARLEGARLARAPIVAYIEDHAKPRSGWLAAVRRAFARSDKIAVVNYAIGQEPDAGYVHRSMQLMFYGHWMEPVPTGPIRYSAQQNIAYRRDLLLDVCQNQSELLETEYLVHRRLLADGWTLWLESDAVVLHECFTDFTSGARGFNALRQVMGATRAQLGGWPQWKRWLWAGGMLLTPFQLIGRLVGSIAPRPALWRDFVLGLPLIVAAHSLGAVSEARGYVLGFGQSRDDFLEMERYAKRVV